MNRKHARFFASLIFLVVAGGSAFAQTLSLGNDVPSPNSSDNASVAVRTDIDLVNPATATGSVSSAKFYWSASGCTNAASIKFFRRVGNTLTLTAERGPFTANVGTNSVTLSPAVPVQQGDLIGIARLTTCGNPAALFGVVSAGYITFPSNVTGSFDFSSGTRQASILGLSASGTATESLARVIPVVGSVAGGFGSQFRTSLQLLNANPGATTITGRLVFHKSSANGSSSDPSLPYSIGPGDLATYSDIVASMGQTGLGSIDVIVPAGQTPPVALARVYNDAGVNGTSGFTEDLVDPAASGSGSRELFAGATGFLIAPIDPLKTRFNIGVRTLQSGATFTATLKDATGSTIATVTKTYPPTWFEQVDATTFFGGIPLGPNQSIQISVSSGSAIIYGSTNDNITNDPSVQFVVPAFAIA